MVARMRGCADVRLRGCAVVWERLLDYSVWTIIIIIITMYMLVSLPHPRDRFPGRWKHMFIPMEKIPKQTTTSLPRRRVRSCDNVLQALTEPVKDAHLHYNQPSRQMQYLSVLTA